MTFFNDKGLQDVISNILDEMAGNRNIYDLALKVLDQCENAHGLDTQSMK